MTTLASDIITRAGTILQDNTYVRWMLPELADWLNEAQRATVLAKPSANASAVLISLAEGTLQTLDAQYLHLLRIMRNVRDVGPPRLGGRAIRPTSRELLDSSSPNWHDPTEWRFRDEARQYIYEEQNPREFYVFPGNDGTGTIEAVVSTLPTEIVATDDVDDIASYGQEIGLPEPYAPVLLDYVLYRAFAKDDVAAESARSRIHYNDFAAALGLKIQVEQQVSPNARARVVA